MKKIIVLTIIASALAGCGGSNTPIPKKVEVTNPDQAELINNMADGHNDSILASILTPAKEVIHATPMAPAMAYPERASIIEPQKLSQETPEKLPPHCLVSQPTESHWTIYNLRVSDEKLASEYADYTDATGIAYRRMPDICQAFALPVTEESQLLEDGEINSISVMRIGNAVLAKLNYEYSTSEDTSKKLLITLNNVRNIAASGSLDRLHTQADGSISQTRLKEFELGFDSLTRGFYLKTGTIKSATSFTPQDSGGIFELMGFYLLRPYGTERPEIKALITGGVLGLTGEQSSHELRSLAAFLESQVSPLLKP